MPRPTTGRRPSGAGFICEPATLEGATDITGLGGWRAWLASCASDPV
ncbi:allophanate hydrolase-related protein [Sphaerotilus sulfidivorans]